MGERTLPQRLPAPSDPARPVVRASKCRLDAADILHVPEAGRHCNSFARRCTSSRLPSVARSRLRGVWLGRIGASGRYAPSSCRRGRFIWPHDVGYR